MTAVGLAAALLSVAVGSAAEFTPNASRLTALPLLTAELSLNGTPVTLQTTVPGQQAYFTIQAKGGELVWVGCQLGTWGDPAEWDPAAKVLFSGPGPQFTSGGCSGPNASVFAGYGVSLRHGGTHTLAVSMTKPETNTVTMRAYKIPKNEATVQPDGTPVSVTTTIPGERPVLRFSGVEGRRYTVTCLLTGATQRGRTFLADPDDGLVMGPDNAECGPGESFTTDPLEQSGLYRLKTHFLDDGTGTFTVAVTPAA